MQLVAKQNIRMRDWFMKNWELLIPYLVFFFTPLTPLLIGVGVLVFADLYTGRSAARTRGEEIRSHGYKRSVSKCTQYFLAIILGRIMEVVFLPMIPVTAITAGYIALTEFKSNIENISTVTGIDIWRAIVDRLQGDKNRKRRSKKPDTD